MIALWYSLHLFSSRNFASNVRIALTAWKRSMSNRLRALPCSCYENKISNHLFFCRILWTPISRIMSGEKLHGMTLVGLSKWNCAFTVPERSTPARSKTIHVCRDASCVSKQVRIVYCVLNWTSRLAIRRVMCSGHRPALFAQMRKSTSGTWSTFFFEPLTEILPPFVRFGGTVWQWGCVGQTP